jgi:hypothetical protein
MVPEQLPLVREPAISARTISTAPRRGASAEVRFDVNGAGGPGLGKHTVHLHPRSLDRRCRASVNTSSHHRLHRSIMVGHHLVTICMSVSVPLPVAIPAIGPAGQNHQPCAAHAPIHPAARPASLHRGRACIAFM